MSHRRLGKAGLAKAFGSSDWDASQHFLHCCVHTLPAGCTRAYSGVEVAEDLVGVGARNLTSPVEAWAVAYVVACSAVWAGWRQSAGTLDSSVPFASSPLGTAHRDGVGKGAEVAGD